MQIARSLPPLVLAIAFVAAPMMVAPMTAAATSPEIRVNTDDSGQLQNEEQICINPTDPLNVVACWRDFRLGYRQVGVGYSLDGGATWTDYLIGGELPWDSDPVLTTDDDGTFYLVVINFQDGGANQLVVHRSSNRGITWDGPFTAVYSNGATFEDKEWIAVDRNGGASDGKLYLAWSRFYDAKIMVVSSTDRAETWTAPVQVSALGATCQWPVPLVMRNGNILVAWDSYDANQILFDISTNGGTTWGNDRILTATGTAAGSAINGNIGVFPYPALVMDESGGPRDGLVYCVYADRAVSANGMDIWCRRSTNHGNNWSVATRVNDDPAGLNRDQFHPWVACGDDGSLVASWHDRRDDPANYLWHIYTSSSTDGGLTWSADERVTSVPSSPANAATSEQPFDGARAEALSPGRSSLVPLASRRAGLIGEYSGITRLGGRTNLIWTDTRNGDQDAYVSYFGPTTDVSETPLGLRALSLSAWPNPSTGGADIHLSLAKPRASARIEVVDQSGRFRRELRVGSLPAGETVVPFDGRDDLGRRLPAGVYWAALEGGPATKLVLIR